MDPQTTPPQNPIQPTTPLTPEPITPAISPTPAQPTTQAMPPAASATSSPPQASSKKRPMLIGLIVLLVLALGGVGYALLGKSNTKKNSTNSATSGSSQNSNTPTATTSGAKTCLVPSDYDSLFGYDNDINFTKDNMHSQPVHFKPDSPDYVGEQSEKDTIDNFAEWYGKLKNTKEFNFILEGGTNDVNTDAASLKLAQARADHVKADLVAEGVPASAIATKVMEKQGDTAIPEIDRVVVIFVDPTCTASSPSTNGQ